MLVSKADQQLVQQHSELEPKIMIIIPGPYSTNAFVISFYLQGSFTPFESTAKGWGISWAWESRHFQNTARHIALIFRKDTAPPQPQSLPCPVSQVFEYPDSKIPLHHLGQVHLHDLPTRCRGCGIILRRIWQRWRQHTFKVPLHSGRCLSYSSLLPAFISRSVASGEGGPMRCGSVTRDGTAVGKMEGASSTLILPRRLLMVAMTTASILTWKAASPYAASTAHSGPSLRKLNCQQR